jgi:hypothetical protein
MTRSTASQHTRRMSRAPVSAPKQRPAEIERSRPYWQPTELYAVVRWTVGGRRVSREEVEGMR